jgi:signal transduction histidine kinase
MVIEQPIHVLLVDDDEDEYVLVRSLAAKAEPRRFELAWTPSYDDALERIGRRAHDVYLVDYRLGARSGLELLAAATAGGCEEPVIVLTGQKDPDLDLEVLQAGAADFIAKHELSAPLLERSIRYAVERAKGAKLATALREQTEIQEVRERLLGIVGHDLRNPLSSIITAAQLLLEATAMPGDAQKRIARTIASSAQRMTRIINELLDFTRCRLGNGLTIEPDWIDCHDLCRRLLDEFQVAHPDRVFRFSAAGQPRVCWDAQRFGQLLSNLVGNAIDHGDPGSPIAVRLHDDGGMVVLEVHNQGPPIPAGLLPHLFDPFRRGDGHGRSREGLGLGLYIVQQIAGGHDGAVAVESTTQAGTSFTVRMPRIPSGCREAAPR